MSDERDDLPRAVCPRCGDAFDDLDHRRGGEIRCHCGARLIIAAPRLNDDRRPRFPD